MRKLAKSIWPSALAISLALLAWGGTAPTSAGQTAAGPMAASAPAGARVTDEGWFAPVKVTRPPLPKEVTRAFALPIRDDIKDGTLQAFKRRIALCREANAELIVLDVDTMGGTMVEALDIARFLKTELTDVYTVCYVRTRAIESGTMIALACNEIVMTPVGKIGDCSPTMPRHELKPMEREKIESVIRSDLAESCELNGYSIALAKSMVSGYETWLVRNRKTRELQYGLAQDWRGRVMVPEGVAEGPSDANSDWELLRVAVQPNELLTLRTSEAVQYGFVRNVVKPALDQPYAAIKDLYHVRGDLTVLPTRSMSFGEALDRVDAAATQPDANSRPQPARQPAAAPAGARSQSAVPSGELLTMRTGAARYGFVRGTAVPAAATFLGEALMRMDPVIKPAAGSRPEAASQPGAPPEGARITDEGWFAPVKVNRPALPKEVTRAFVIPVREEITEKTFEAMERKVRRCRQSGAELVILDMDTWGGQVIAGLDIARLIKENLADTYTVCYVRTRAVSAGSLIGLACNEIVMTPVGKLGDCAPILSTGEKLEGREREKIETVLRTEFTESAERNGYSNALAQSMVSAYEVWLVRNKKTRELQYVLAKDWRGRVSGAAGATSAPSNPAADWEMVKVVLAEGELLTMKTNDAVQYGFVRNVVKLSTEQPYEAIRDLYSIQGELTVLSDTWSEKMVAFLTSAEVTAILIFAAIVCGYIELNVPGHIVPGVIAVLCLVVAFGSRYMTGMANWWAIALFAVGVVLILLEIFVLTGFGFPGVLGILCCAVGLVAMLLPYRPGPIPLPKTNMDWNIFLNGLFAMGVAFVCAVVAVFALASYLPKLPVAGRLVLAPVFTAPDSALTGASPLLRIKPGDLGIVEAVLRPVGKVRFGEDLLDAVSEGGVIEREAEVRVLRREGNRVVVEKL